MTDVLTVPPDATVSEFFWHHLLGSRQTSVPVVDGARYVGTVRIDEIRDLDRGEWDTTLVKAVLRDDLPTGRPEWTLGQALRTMEAADIDRLSVIDADDSFVGVVSTGQILKLDDILDQTEG